MYDVVLQSCCSQLTFAQIMNFDKESSVDDDVSIQLCLDQAELGDLRTWLRYSTAAALSVSQRLQMVRTIIVAVLSWLLINV